MKEYIISFCKFITVFLAPISSLMMVVGIVIFADTYFGRWSARKSGVEVTSKKTREGLVPKMVGYQLSIISMFLLDGYMLNEVIINYIPFAYLATKATGSFLIWIEWSSINESYKKIYGYTINDKIGEFFKSIKGWFAKLIEMKKQL